jgi:glutathionylspermidine synthase
LVNTVEMRVGEPLADDDYRALKQRAIFECSKWDPQVGDTETIARFPLLLSPSTWRVLAHDAEALHRETIAAEHALLEQPALLRDLTLPRAIRKVLSSKRARFRASPPLTPGIARVMRFDFHPTTSGFAVSEVNCDVPGGYIESSGITALMSLATGHATTGDPARALVDAVCTHIENGVVALVHATAYVDDAQQMEYLARHFRARGLEPVSCAPNNVPDATRAILRFFPAEWLPNLPRRARASRFFRGGTVPVSNPGQALVVQSKRLPLVWDALGVDVSTWKRLLPETCDPRALTRKERESPSFVIKPALGRVGEGVALSGAIDEKKRRAILRTARIFPRHFVAQRRFDARAFSTPAGPVYPCVGVFTVDGRAVGCYGRVSRSPLIDHRAIDVAVLLEHP